MKPSKEDAENAIKTLIHFIEDNPNRLKDVPEKVIKSYLQIFSGYENKLEDVLSVYESSEFHQMILLKDIPFSSMCEHHFLPMYGFVDVAYTPEKCAVGNSKIIALINACSKRLQLQERITNTIADVIQEKLDPKGVAVRVRANHTCLSMRGKGDPVLYTKKFTGIFLTNDSIKNEFLNQLS